MNKVKVPIFAKIFILNTVMLSAVTLLILYNIKSHFEAESLKREEEVSVSKVKSKALEVDNIFQSYLDKIRFYSLYLIQNKQSQDILDSIIENEHELVRLKIIFKSSDQLAGSITKKDIFEKYNASEDYFENLDLEHKDSLSSALNGQIFIKNISKKDGIPLLWIAMPIIKNDLGEVLSIASAYIRLEKVQQSFSEDEAQTTFLISDRGEIIAHPSEELALKHEDVSDNKIVQEAIGHHLRLQNKIHTIDDKKTMTAFAKTKFGFIVISQIDMDKIMSPIAYIKQQSTFILTIILSISFIVIALFGQTLSNPIEKLLEFTKKIAQGEFDLNITNSIKSHDEVGSLAMAFDNMTVGLKEREKIKTVLNKFHGSAVAEDMMKREISRHATRKKSTVFFSDIRSFTKMSESQTAEETVEMLNEYFEIMVGIINKNGGVVDKFVGDAIMAVWGVPTASEDDTLNALNACLEMRVALNLLNQKRIAEDKVPLMIGMGLHVGEVVSGTIGSDERMEYTVIGDTVNTASRIESSTKSFGTDLLISEAVFQEISASFIIEDAGFIEAKGKSLPLRLFFVEGKVSGGIPQIIRTPYSNYEAGVDEEKTKKVAG